MTKTNSSMIMRRRENVLMQYESDQNLAMRISLHEKYSVNKQGFASWLFEQYALPQNAAILEMGCGNAAQWESRMACLPKGAGLTLSDISEGMLSAARARLSAYENIAYKALDIQAIPFEAASFDVVIANHMLYHVPDLDKALREVRRVLKENGVFYAATNGAGGMRAFLRKALTDIQPETTAFSQPFSFTLQNGDALLRRHFKTVERRDYTDALAITCTRDLIDWLKSTLSISGFNQQDFPKLYEYFEAIRIQKGVIPIPKEAGLFISR